MRKSAIRLIDGGAIVSAYFFFLLKKEIYLIVEYEWGD